MSTELKPITNHLEALSREWYCEQNAKLNSLTKRMFLAAFNELGDWIDRTIIDRGARNLIHKHLSEANLEVMRVLATQETIIVYETDNKNQK